MPINTEYFGGFQYENNVLQFFPHAEGYVKATASVGRNGQVEYYYYNYVFNYTDHLGNIRVSYAYDPNIDGLKILEENHYYAFGLKHQNYNVDKLDFDTFPETGVEIIPTDNPMYKYKYNGKELQEELGLNMYDYGARNYDPALGRWMNIDPLAEKSRRWSPYTYCYNNPMIFTDPDGMLAKWEPKIVNEKDSNGKTTNSYLALKKESKDNATTLATALSISQEDADKLYSTLSPSNMVKVPDAIAEPINNAINDANKNPDDYGDSLMPDAFESNYNCFESTSSIAQGETPDFNNVMSPTEFSNSLKTDYEHADSPSDYVFGKTAIRFGENQTNIFGMTSNHTTHGATYLGTSQNGTIWTWSKNGMLDKPGINKLSTLENTYGKNQGVGPTKNETGFYNLKK